jgi:NitT/TauT family transport system substrate-binding protein
MKRLFCLVLAGACAAGLSACGGGDASAKSAAGPTKVKVSVVPSIDAASLWIAQEQGYFREHGLNVELAAAGSGPAAVASVVSNTTQFGLAANVAILTARSHNVPLVVAAPAAGTGSTPEQSKDELLVKSDSPVKSFADLPGKTVAVVAVKNSPELFIRSLVDQAGADSSKVHFVELPFNQMGAALDSGRVAAIAVSEPFLSATRSASQVRSLGSYIHDALGDDTGYTYWFTSKKYAASDPQAVAGFRAALAQAGAYADKNPDAVRKVLAAHLQTQPGVLAKVHLPSFGNELSTASFDRVADLMKKYGYLKEYDSNGLLADPKSS